MAMQIKGAKNVAKWLETETCIFCHAGEPSAHICSVCTQKLLVLSSAKLHQGYALAKGMGYIRKADVLRYLWDRRNQGAEKDL